MDGNFWLLLLIIVIAGLVGGTILFLMRYAKLKEEVNRVLKDSRDLLVKHREKLRTSNREYLSLFPDQDAGRSGSPAREFQRSYEQAQKSNLNGIREQQRISRSLPRKENASLDYWLGELDRMQIWRRANQETSQLKMELQANENRIEAVERSLQVLKDLPLKTAGQARSTRELLRETKDLLEALTAEYSLGGSTMEDSLQLVAEIEKDLEKIPGNFFNLSPDELAALPNIRSEAVEASPILEQDADRLDKLNAQSKEWKAKIEELGKRSVDLEEQVKETDLILKQLEEYLVLSEEQEQFTSLSQMVDQAKASLDAPTVEELDPAMDEAQNTLDALTTLNQKLNEYGTRLKTFQDLHAMTSEQLQAVDNTMKAASARQEYPLQWNASQTVFDGIQGSLASIPSIIERRTPGELAKNLETAGTCAESLLKLQETTEKTVADLEQLSRLWVQLKPAYTREWLAGVEQLFSEVKIYDMESNWASSDQVRPICSDAGDLLRRAANNIASEASLAVPEEKVNPKLLEAKDLEEKKTLFEDRKTRIETRLRQMQEEEKEARNLLNRISPVVILFASEIRIINIPTKSARDMQAANTTRVDLENSLGQRNAGNVSKKLEEVHLWERSTAENGAMVCRWVEEDRLKRMVSISGCLREMETFAVDLTDELVVKAHKYDLEYAPTPIDTECLKTQSLDAIQDDAASLFVEWHEVMEIQGELQKFIAPVREEHDRMLAALKDLHENCEDLETQLNRVWPVVFQTAGILRGRVENLTKAVEGSKNLRWSCNDLQRNYYYLWQTLHDLDSEVKTIRHMDEQDVGGDANS